MMSQKLRSPTVGGAGWGGRSELFFISGKNSEKLRTRNKKAMNGWMGIY